MDARGLAEVEGLNHLIRAPDAVLVVTEAHDEAHGTLAERLHVDLLNKRAQIVLAALLAAHVDPGVRLSGKKRLHLATQDNRILRSDVHCVVGEAHERWQRRRAKADFADFKEIDAWRKVRLNPSDQRRRVGEFGEDDVQKFALARGVGG
jgi:hypothetical protein